jgi:2-dehydro-3-deoxyphosphogluconate aldolase/(4S)-4-hydroxy-2-oxoglutarate aldolase
MTKQQVRDRIEKIGIIPAVRLSSAEDALFAAEAITTGGIPILEITMTVPGATQVIYELAREHTDMVVGAGTVFDVEVARRCLDVGAAFLTSPGLDLEVLEYGLKSNAVVFPGAMTPTEVMTAWKRGADFVKIFPCAQAGGASYIKALRGPFPDVPLIASGGVNQQTIEKFISAGAVAVGIGQHLIDPKAIQRREGDWVRELARRYLQMVKHARGEHPMQGLWDRRIPRPA